MEIYFQRAFFGNKTKIMVIYVHILGRTVPRASIWYLGRRFPWQRWPWDSDQYWSPKMSKMHILFSNVKFFTFETSYDAKNMHFLIKSSNTENLNPPGPLLWDRVARIVHDIGNFDKNESNLEKLSCFVDIEQNLFLMSFITSTHHLIKTKSKKLAFGDFE